MEYEDTSLICFGHRSRKAARAVTRAFNLRLKPLNLQITQFILLGMISRTEDLSIAALADEVGVEPSAVLRNLRVLEERGLISSEGGRGRAGRRLRLTDAGHALIAQSVPARRAVQEELTILLGPDADETRAALLRLERAALALDQSKR